jgi:dephospho-CoA kinase
MVLGLTGGIGCGKSAALAMFGHLGFNTVDADQLAKSVLVRPEVVARLVERWGPGCLGPEGLPDRSWIARKVFGAPAELAFLEAILHPEVAQLRAAAVADPERRHIVEIPLLFEKSLQSQYDCVICIAASDAVRLRRLEQRGLSAEEARRRMDSQMPLSEKVAKSDYVLWNDGDLPALEAQVQRLVERVSERARGRI